MLTVAALPAQAQGKSKGKGAEKKAEKPVVVTSKGEVIAVDKKTAKEIDKAARKLSVECSADDKDDAKQRFEERFSTLLDAVKQLEVRDLPEEAVRGMLPKTKIGDQMYRKLKVYARADHPHTAQQPAKIEVQ